MRRRSTLAVALVLASGAVSGLSGCGDDTSSSAEGSASASATPSDDVSSSSSSSEPSGSPSAVDSGSAEASGFPRDLVEAASLHRAVLVSSVASTPEEKAVVDAWMDYWQGAADMNYFQRTNTRFTDAATGQAESDLVAYMNRKKNDGQRVVGWAKDNVVEVEVRGSTAKIRDCTENFTYSVDREAESVTHPPPWYDSTGTLRKIDGRWVVTTMASPESKKSCLP